MYVLHVVHVPSVFTHTYDECVHTDKLYKIYVLGYPLDIHVSIVGSLHLYIIHTYIHDIHCTYYNDLPMQLQVYG